MKQRQSNAISYSRRGNNFSLSPGVRTGVRASFHQTNFYLWIRVSTIFPVWVGREGVAP